MTIAVYTPRTAEDSPNAEPSVAHEAPALTKPLFTVLRSEKAAIGLACRMSLLTVAVAALTRRARRRIARSQSE